MLNCGSVTDIGANLCNYTFQWYLKFEKLFVAPIFIQICRIYIVVADQWNEQTIGNCLSNCVRDESYAVEHVLVATAVVPLKVIDKISGVVHIIDVLYAIITYINIIFLLLVYVFTLD